MASLIHEGATIKLPSASPAVTLVIIRLWSTPENIHVYHMNLAKTFFYNGALKQL